MNGKNVFIVNKGSSTGKGEIIWNEIEDYLKTENIEYEAFFTKKANDATIFAKEATSSGPCNLFVMGGDGTINEAINGILDFENTYFCCLPSGSANDFAKGIGLEHNSLEILKKALAKENVRKLDLGRVFFEDKSRLFAVSSGIGVDAYVCLQALDSKLKRFLNKFHMGSATYGLLTVGDLFTMPLSNAIITYDGNEKKIKNGIFIAAMNCPYEGGGIPMVPYAKADSGFLSAFAAHDIKRIKCFGLLPFLVAGKHEGKKGFDFIDFDTMTVIMDKPMCVHADGEHIGFMTEVTFKCEKSILNFIGL